MKYNVIVRDTHKLPNGCVTTTHLKVAEAVNNYYVSIIIKALKEEGLDVYYE